MRILKAGRIMDTTSVIFYCRFQWRVEGTTNFDFDLSGLFLTLGFCD